MTAFIIEQKKKQRNKYKIISTEIEEEEIEKEETKGTERTGKAS